MVFHVIRRVQTLYEVDADADGLLVSITKKQAMEVAADGLSAPLPKSSCDRLKGEYI